MSLSDPVADMLTSIRNGVRARYESVKVPASKFKSAIAKLLLDEGFINDFLVEGDGKEAKLCIYLKYGDDGESVISGIRRVSKPGLRRYVKCGEIPVVLSGLGVSVVSSSKGLLSDTNARQMNYGGEIICEIW